MIKISNIITEATAEEEIIDSVNKGSVFPLAQPLYRGTRRRVNTALAVSTRKDRNLMTTKDWVEDFLHFAAKKKGAKIPNRRKCVFASSSAKYAREFGTNVYRILIPIKGSKIFMYDGQDSYESTGTVADIGYVFVSGTNAFGSNSEIKKVLIDNYDEFKDTKFKYFIELLIANKDNRITNTKIDNQKLYTVINDISAHDIMVFGSKLHKLVEKYQDTRSALDPGVTTSMIADFSRDIHDRIETAKTAMMEYFQRTSILNPARLNQSAISTSGDKEFAIECDYYFLVDIDWYESNITPIVGK